VTAVDGILRSHSVCNIDAKPLSIRSVAAAVLLLGPVYGIAMGSYAWGVGDRDFIRQIPQMIYSGTKVPLLIAITVLVSLPSFFVLNTLMGLRSDFREALSAIVAAQAGMVIILCSLFPLTLFFYVSVGDSSVSYQLAILFNAGMFGLASVSAQIQLRSYYRRLIDRDMRHRWMVRMWILVYAFVGIQAGYVLRPFIGNPSNPTTFLRRDSFQNAYVKLFSIVSDVIDSLFGYGM
jgi:hypothetical protein